MIVNFDEIGLSSYIDEAGEYNLKIMSYETGTTQNGTGYHRYSCEDKNKKKIKVTLYLSEKSLFRYKLFLKALGLDPKGEIDIDAIPEKVIGKIFKCYIDKREPKLNILTNEMEESKYYEVIKFM